MENVSPDLEQPARYRVEGERDVPERDSGLYIDPQMPANMQIMLLLRLIWRALEREDAPLALINLAMQLKVESLAKPDTMFRDSRSRVSNLAADP